MSVVSFLMQFRIYFPHFKFCLYLNFSLINYEMIVCKLFETFVVRALSDLNLLIDSRLEVTINTG
jgi:hypothetical protein